MTSRTGVPSLILVARELCRLIFKFSPVIQRAYPSNLALQAALLAANSACDVLRLELEGVRDYGD